MRGSARSAAWGIPERRTVRRHRSAVMSRAMGNGDASGNAGRHSDTGGVSGYGRDISSAVSSWVVTNHCRAMEWAAESNQPPIYPLLDLSGSRWLRSIHPWARFCRADGGADGQEYNEEQGPRVKEATFPTLAGATISSHRRLSGGGHEAAAPRKFSP